MNEEVVLRVTDLARGGAGVSRDESGRVVFIPYSAPGDLIRARIVVAEKRYAHAEILEILEPSEVRQAPPCPAFGKCGGCQWQHLPYSLQWETKVKGVLHALSRVHLSTSEAIDQIPASRIWEYRNRVQLRGDGNHLGFYKAGSHEPIWVDRCDIARPEINQSWEQTREEGAQLAKPYKVEVEVTSLGEIRRSWNAAHSAMGFRQVHDEQNEKLKGWVSSALRDADVLYDLFGGAGNFSLSLLNKMKEIHCIDLTVPKTQPQGVPDRVHFHRSSVTKWLLKRKNSPRSEKNGIKSGAAIIDPPREGLGEQFSEIESALKGLSVQEVVAVGCDTDSWIRDLSRWVKKGWGLKKVMAIDLFPQTSHIETVALLSL